MMARYRSGNRYLSEAEHTQEVSFYWGAGLFLIGAIVTGIILHSIVPPHWYKPVRFLLQVVPAIGVGSALAYFQKAIRTVLGIILVIALLVWIAEKIFELV